MSVVRLAADRGSEIAQSAPELPPDLRQPLGTEHQQCDDEDEQEMRGLKDVADHMPRLANSRCGVD